MTLGEFKLIHKVISILKRYYAYDKEIDDAIRILEREIKLREINPVTGEIREDAN